MSEWLPCGQSEANAKVKDFIAPKSCDPLEEGYFLNGGLGELQSDCPVALESHIQFFLCSCPAVLPPDLVTGLLPILCQGGPETNKPLTLVVNISGDKSFNIFWLVGLRNHNKKGPT